MRTRHAIMFRLSNKVVQVNFQDHTEIMLSSETKIVTYVNKLGERKVYPLNTAMESSNLEMVKRLKYTKAILTHMLNQNALGVKPPTYKNEAVGNKEIAQNKFEGTEPALDLGKPLRSTARAWTKKLNNDEKPKTQATDRYSG